MMMPQFTFEERTSHFRRPSSYPIDRVGYLATTLAIRDIVGVIQRGVTIKWCASYWDEIPSDELRGYIGWDMLLTYVIHSNLDFTNTPFQHRYNKYTVKPYYPQLGILAMMEENFWGVEAEAFIPFKNPQPSGYKGVWGNFNKVPRKCQGRIRVQDRFTHSNVLMYVSATCIPVEGAPLSDMRTIDVWW